MKILLLGKDGQVGWELQRALSPLGELTALGRHEADLTELDNLRKCIRKHKPTFLVNAAAYTAVDKAELETEKAKLINETAVSVLASEAAELGCWLIHYSTDYVFDGQKSSPYIESDTALPLSTYGKTKLGGEQAIKLSGCKHLIFRSSWVYSNHGGNFPLTILRRAQEQDQLEVVSDCIGAPTSARLIADATAFSLYRVSWDTTLSDNCTGLYHLVASGSTSWYDYAKYLVNAATKKGIPLKTVPNKIFPTSIDRYNAAAKRPKNSQLNNKKFSDAFELKLHEWQIYVDLFLDELIKTKRF